MSHPKWDWSCQSCMEATRNFVWLAGAKADEELFVHNYESPDIRAVVASMMESSRIKEVQVKKVLELLGEDETAEEAADCFVALSRSNWEACKTLIDEIVPKLIAVAADDGSPGQRGALLALGNIMARAPMRKKKDETDARTAMLTAVNQSPDCADAGVRALAFHSMSKDGLSVDLSQQEAEQIVLGIHAVSKGGDDNDTRRQAQVSLVGCVLGAFRQRKSRDALMRANVLESLERYKQDAIVGPPVQHLFKHADTSSTPLKSVEHHFSKPATKKLTSPLEEQDSPPPKRVTIQLPELPVKSIAKEKEEAVSPRRTLFQSEVSGSKTQISVAQDVSTLAPGFQYQYFDATDEGFCRICREPLDGRCVSLGNGGSLHLDCFRCHACNTAGFNGLYWEHDSQVLCRTDYLSATGVVCYGCKLVVKESLVRAMQHVWHLNCFVCSAPDCGQPFERGFYGHEGKAYCTKHISDVLGTKCAACGEGVVGGIKALDAVWHATCFRCTGSKCGGKSLVGQTQTDKEGEDSAGFFEIDGKPYCLEDAVLVREQANQKQQCCSKCQEPLEGGVVIDALDGLFHRACFVCHCCGDETIAETGFFAGPEGMPVCSVHRFGKCSTCGEAFTHDTLNIVSALSKQYHGDDECFRCEACRCSFGEGGFFDISGQAFCKSCAKVAYRSK